MAEVTLSKIREIFLAMQRVGGEKTNKTFAYGLSKNNSRLQEDLTAIAESEKVSSDFDTARVALCEKYATKGEDGKPLSQDGAYVGLNDNKEFIDAFAVIREKYKPLIEENIALMNKKVTIDFFMIPFDAVPEIISPADFDVLSVMIEDPKESSPTIKVESTSKDNK